MTRCRLWRGLLAGFVGWVTLNVAGVISCGSGGPTDPPTPGPTPTASATPSPINRIFPSTLVHADGGTRWNPPLYGAVICCASGGPVDEGIVRGWELITFEAAKEFADHGVNATALRTGPYPEGHESYRTYDQLRQAVQLLGSLGIMADVSLIDAWVLKHGLSRWPGESCSTFRQAPRAHHKAHIRAVVQAANSPWTYFTVGNEVSLCGATEEWYRGVVDEARAAGAQIVGGDADYDFLDFEEEHGWRLPIPRGKPKHLSESNNEPHSPQDWLELFKNAEQIGGTVYYWAGPANDAERAETLRLLKEWLDAGKPRATACDMPTECPPITKWGAHSYHCEGDTCVLDSTPKFAGRRPCNEERNAACSCTGQDEPPMSAAWRRCEPPLGPRWDGIERVMPNPYQAKARVGSVVRVCPDEGSRNYHGEEIRIGPDACTQFVVEYR